MKCYFYKVKHKALSMIFSNENFVIFCFVFSCVLPSSLYYLISTIKYNQKPWDAPKFF